MAHEAKSTYFLKALHAGAASRRAWVYSLFSVTNDEQINEPYPYQIFWDRPEEGPYYLDPEDQKEVYLDVQYDRTVPLFQFREAITLQAGDLLNLKEDVVTTYGNVLANYLLLVLPFGSTLDFITGKVKIKAIEAEIEKRLIDDPELDDGSPPPSGSIYVRQYKQFADNALSLVGYNNLAVVSISEKSLVGHPDARKRREELIEQHKDRLSDPAVVAEIGKELSDLDREWLKDDPTAEFYGVKPGKYYDKTRRKAHYVGGGESAFTEGTEVEFIKKSLEEGIDLDHYPALINSLRHGSYNRGFQTQLGGESAKTIFRMMGTSQITEKDCGTTIGLKVELNENNYQHFRGFYQIKGQKVELTTDQNLKAQIGQVIEMRTPLTCKTEGRNVCEQCMGPKLAEQPGGLASASANTGGVFLSLFLAMMHGTVLETHPWDHRQEIR